MEAYPVTEDNAVVFALTNRDDAKKAADAILASTKPVPAIFIGPGPPATSVDSDSTGLVLGAIAERKYGGDILALGACRIPASSPAATHLLSILEYVDQFAYMTAFHEAEIDSEERNILDLAEVLSKAGHIKGFGFHSGILARKNLYLQIILSSLSKVDKLTLNDADIEGDVSKELFALLQRSPRMKDMILEKGTIGLSYLLELLTLVRDTEIEIMSIPMPPDLSQEERDSLFDRLTLCKKLRKLTITPINDTKEKEEAKIYLLPRLLKFNASYALNNNRSNIAPRTLYFIGHFNVSKIEGVKIAQNASIDSVNTVNHSTVVFNNMTESELRRAFSDNKIIHRNVRDIRIYDSDTTNLVSYINDPLRYHSAYRRLVVQNSGLVSSDLGQASLFSTIESLFINDNEGITSLSGLKRWEILSTLKAEWCGLTSIDLPERPRTALRDLDVSFNLQMMEIPVRFALKYPNTRLRARQCGFSLLPPYSHPAIEDMGKFIRYMCAVRALELIADDVGVSTAPDLSYIPYEHFKM